MIEEKDESLSISDEEKTIRMLMKLIPKKNKVFELIKNNKLSVKDIRDLTVAFSTVGAFHRKIIANSVLVAICLKTREREIKQISRELMRRHKTRKRYSANQRAYFENLLVFGWGEAKEKGYIRREIVSVIKEELLIKENILYFEENGLNISTLLTKLKRRNTDYEEVFNEYRNNLKYPEQMRNKLINMKEKARERIRAVSDEINRIKRGYQRPYIGY